MNGEGRKLETVADVAFFIRAGDAIFTIKHTVSGHHLTYRMQVCDENPELYFIKVLTGPDNTSSYTYLGTVREDKYISGLKYNHGAKSSIGKDAKTATIAYSFFECLNKKALPSTWEVWHTNRCCRCARLLTTPESVERGLGPECAKHL